MADGNSREDKIKERYELLKLENDTARLVQQADVAKGPALRPNDEFIRQHTGQVQTDKQLQERAEQVVDHNTKQRQADRVEDKELGRAGRDQSRGRPHSNREALRNQERGEGRNTGSMRDKLRNQNDRGQGQGLDPNKRGGITR